MMATSRRSYHIGCKYQLKKCRGLYCPPLIPAGIRRNPGIPGIPRNKIWLGNQPNKIFIPAEFRRGSKFCRNGSRNFRNGISWEWTRNGIRGIIVDFLFFIFYFLFFFIMSRDIINHYVTQRGYYNHHRLELHP